MTGNLPGVPAAHAAESATEGVVYIISTLVGVFITFTNIVMWILFSFLGPLLDPAFIFDMRANDQPSPLYLMLRDIWQFSRDLVNVGFAIMLIIGAVMTIVKASGDFLKQYARKFVVAVIAVNFSWFVPQVIFDMAQVGAATIYQLPSLMESTVRCEIPSDINPEERKDCEIITKIVFFEAAERQWAVTPGMGLPGPVNPDQDHGWRCPLGGFLLCYEYSSMYRPGVSIRPDLMVINGLVINHARLRTLAEVVQPPPGDIATTDLRAVKELLVYLMKLLLVLVLHVALLFPLAAMVAAFFIRIPILWITMAFMPFVLLEYVMGGQFFKDFSPMEKIWKTFLGAALLPVTVAIPFTIGFMVINAASGIAAPDSFTSANGAFSLFQGISDLWQLLWLCLALGIIWTQVFAAIGSFKAAEGVTKYIQGMGKATGQLAAYPVMNTRIPFLGFNLREATQFGNPQRWINAASPRTGDRRTILQRLRGDPNPTDIDRAEQVIQNADLRHPRITPHLNILANPNTDLTSNDAQTALNTMVEELKEIHRDNQEFRRLDRNAVLEGLLRKQDPNLDAALQGRIRTAMYPPIRNAAPPPPPPPPPGGGNQQNPNAAGANPGPNQDANQNQAPNGNAPNP